MREAFEKYQIEESHRLPSDLTRIENGEYWSLELEWDWQLWKRAWEMGHQHHEN